MKEILFYPDRKKSLVTILISILFSGLAIYLLYSQITFSKIWWISLIMLILFGVASVIISYKTFVKPTSSLKLNEKGIFIHRCPSIEWNNVRDIQVKNIRMPVTRSTYLCVLPYNVNKLMVQEKLSYIKKINLILTKVILGTILVVRIDNLFVSQKDLIELISEFKKNWANKYLKN